MSPPGKVLWRFLEKYHTRIFLWKGVLEKFKVMVICEN